MTLDMSSYSPGRFSSLVHLPFVRRLWEFLADDSRVLLMTRASDEGGPALGPLLDEVESRFGHVLSSPEFPEEEIAVLVNNMIKQIMEKKGYELAACVMCPAARYIKSSGLFRLPARQ